MEKNSWRSRIEPKKEPNIKHKGEEDLLKINFDLIEISKQQMTFIDNLKEEIETKDKVIEELRNKISKLKEVKQDQSKNDVIIPIISQKRGEGLTDQDIANFLNKNGHTNSRNNKFSQMQVNRLRKKHLKNLK